MQAGTRFTYPGGMEGRVDLVDLIAPRPGVEPATSRSRVRRRTAAPPRHQFPRSKSVTNWRLPRNKSATSPQHKRQLCNKSVTSWRGQKSVVCCLVSFPKFHYNDLLPTSWQLPRLWGSYGETCVMDFGHNAVQSVSK